MPAARAEQANAKKEAEAIHDQALEIQHAMTPDVLADFQVQLPEMRKLALEEIERRAAQAERELAAAPSVSAGVEDSLKKLQKQVRRRGPLRADSSDRRDQGRPGHAFWRVGQAAAEARQTAGAPLGARAV